ncbi:hypothetical protein CDIK_3562 [Cucumispora dikerogammari]|nr:hypothetical protein CDIK_3562 [Cucumispora dikerogammari]
MKKEYRDALIKKCTSKLTTKNDNVITHTQHNYESNNAKTEPYLCHTKLKHLAKTSALRTSNIITSITKKYSNKEVNNTPNRKIIINLTNRVKNKNTKGFISSLLVILNSLRTNHRRKKSVRYSFYDHKNTQEKTVFYFFQTININF